MAGTRPDSTPGPNNQEPDMSNVLHGDEARNLPEWGSGVQEEMLRLSAEHERAKEQLRQAKMHGDTDEIEAASKKHLKTLDAYSIAKVNFTNDGFTLLRWMVTDSPETVEQHLKPIMDRLEARIMHRVEAQQKDLEEVAAAVVHLEARR